MVASSHPPVPRRHAPGGAGALQHAEGLRCGFGGLDQVPQLRPEGRAMAEVVVLLQQFDHLLALVRGFGQHQADRCEGTERKGRRVMQFGSHPHRLVTITEFTRAFDVSQNHLMKVVDCLAAEDLIKSVRSKTGGITSARDPASIRVGEIVRLTEAHFKLVECFDAGSGRCCKIPVCALRERLRDGLEPFFVVLDRRTWADLAQRCDDYLAVPPFRTNHRRPLPEETAS